ncbi:MAG: GDSL-type esterase/lipase family protein, partial [Lysobacterales bacterium]
AGGAARIEAELARSRPGLVVIELGANDGLRGLPPPQTRANLARMIEASQRAGVKVLLIGMRMPPNYGRAYTTAFAGNYAALARQYKIALLPFLLAPIALDRDAYLPDNLHPNAASQLKLRDHVWPALMPLLK